MQRWPARDKGVKRGPNQAVNPKNAELCYQVAALNARCNTLANLIYTI